MGIGSGSTNERRSPQMPDLESEITPLLPKAKEEVFHEFSGGSFSGAVFNLSTTIVGAGIMALPATMKMLGLIPGILMVILVGLLTERSINLLLKPSRESKVAGYGWLMRESYGLPGRLLLQSTIVLNTVGVLIVYMIIIADVLSGTSSTGIHHPGILDGWFGAHLWNSRPIALLVTVLFVFSPLVSVKRLDCLKYTSALSVALAVVFVAITAGIAIIKLIQGTVEMPRLFPEIDGMESVWKLFTAVPVIVTAYMCHINVHEIEKELRDKSQMTPIVQTSLALCSSVYILTSFFAYLLFGTDIQDDVMANFNTNLGIPGSAFFNDVVRVAYVVHLMLVFPILFFPLRLNLDGILFPSRRRITHDNRRFAVMTALLLVTIYSAAIFIPSIWDVFQFTGATASMLIGFIIPAMITLKNVFEVSTSGDKFWAVIMIVLSVFASTVAIYSDVLNIIHRKEEQ